MKQQKQQIMTKSTIRGSYLMHADEYTKVFMNKIEELGLDIQKSKVIIKGKLWLSVTYNLPLVIN